jgi:hypothetical protein
LLYFPLFFGINNSTVNALTTNDILGEVLESYEAAHGIEEEEEQVERGNLTEIETNTTEANTNTMTIMNIANTMVLRRMQKWGV